ncbi:MAG: ABC transporter permease subunit [Anaeromicrobium sp.]|jgi:NitT/TauT family transport system permease protein|uniref:ABC transporter permease n=1 Tax=Anaeromicrobium sp. TaxID=1929132 RepID=UPI0025D810AB|nr:ABC transporter permease subunit [Anaeromicrobium sp.]MCT4595923.1 ABC transporter permease subunit [Anaeromicrobium sp.]
MRIFIIRLKKFFPILFWIIIWQIIASLLNREVYLPTPINTIKALFNIVQTKGFFMSISYTLLRVFAGFFVSFTLGIIIGLFSSFNKYIYNLLNPLVICIKSTPVISIIIIFLSWFKSGVVPVIITFLMCFPIIWTNVVEGIKNTDKLLVDMAKIYKVSKYNILKHIYLPSILPYIVSGSLTALGLGWKVAVAAEVLSQPTHSIGAHLYDSKIYLETESLFAWTLIVIILSFLFEHFFKYIISIKMKGRI